MKFRLNFRVMQQKEESPDQTGGRRLHAGQEQIDHVVEQSVIS